MSFCQFALAIMLLLLLTKNTFQNTLGKCWNVAKASHGLQQLVLKVEPEYMSPSTGKRKI